MQGGQVLMITTQSDEPPAGIWKTELEKARKIRDGEAGSSPILLPVLYEFPQDLQRNQSYWRDVKNWKYLLPNLGRSINPQRLQDDYENNGRVTAQAEQIWASQHLNIQIGVGLGDQNWRAVDYWSDAADPSLTLESLIARSEVATIGFDIGGLDDLFGVAVIGRERGTRHWLMWNKAWAVRDILNIRKDIAPKLLECEAEGSMEFVSKPGDLAPKVVDIVERVSQAGLLPAKDAFAFDPNNIGAIVEELAGRGLGDAMLRRLLTQGPALSPAIYMIPMKLADGTFHHAGQALMDFCVGNAKIEMVGNGLKMTKQIAGSAKIDPVIAALCAAMVMSWNPSAVTPATSPWDDPSFSLVSAA
jgi:phage terminase large subunit-like protein